MTTEIKSNVPEWEVFVAGLDAEGVSSESETSRLGGMWPEAEQAATDAIPHLSPVGWVSFRKPFIAFVNISRYLDELQRARELTDEHIQLVLTILRMRSASYRKAERVFAVRVHRLSAADRDKLPHTAKQFMLAVAQLY